MYNNRINMVIIIIMVTIAIIAIMNIIIINIIIILERKHSLAESGSHIQLVSTLKRSKLHGSAVIRESSKPSKSSENHQRTIRELSENYERIIRKSSKPSKLSENHQIIVRESSKSPLSPLPPSYCIVIGYFKKKRDSERDKR